MHTIYFAIRINNKRMLGVTMQNNYLHLQEGGETIMILCNQSWVYLTNKMWLILLLSIHRCKVYPISPLYYFYPSQFLKQLRVGNVRNSKGGYIPLCKQPPDIEKIRGIVHYPTSVSGSRYGSGRGSEITTVWFKRAEIDTFNIFVLNYFCA